MGADSLDQSELDDGWSGSTLFADSCDALVHGDLRWWCARGLITAADVVLLCALDPHRPEPDARGRVFISTGSVLLDAVAIGACLVSVSRE